MDYSQIVASQIISADTSFRNENEFYEVMGQKGFPRLREAYRTIREIFEQTRRRIRPALKRLLRGNSTPANVHSFDPSPTKAVS